MRRILGDLAVLVVLATIVLGGLLVYHPVGRSTVLHGYVLVVGALAMLAALAATRKLLPAAGRSAFAAALHRPPPEDERPPQLARVERSAALGTAYAFELHQNLRPQLREIAQAQLAARGVELDSPAGREAVGEEAWELLRPDRGEPENRFAPGIERDRLRRLVRTLENLRP